MFGDDEAIRSDKDLAEDYRRGLEVKDRIVAQYERDNLELRIERDKLRDAIRRAGFEVCQTSGDWTIHESQVQKSRHAKGDAMSFEDSPVDREWNPTKEEWEAMSWTTFYFNGNQAWGLVDSPAEWERIKTAYRDCVKHGACASPAELLDAKNYPYARPDMPPMFGFVVECLEGTQTLREFFSEHGMEVGEL